MAQFDAGCADDFKHAITPVLNETRKLVLDLAAVEFIDSRGCGAILHCLKRLNEKGGELRICQVRPFVRSVFELIRLHRICEILPTRDEAIRSFPAAPSPGAVQS
jgi:anti-sigma B factor antagonist